MSLTGIYLKRCRESVEYFNCLLYVIPGGFVVELWSGWVSLAARPRSRDSPSSGPFQGPRLSAWLVKLGKRHAGALSSDPLLNCSDLNRSNYRQTRRNTGRLCRPRSNPNQLPESGHPHSGHTNVLPRRVARSSLAIRTSFSSGTSAWQPSGSRRAGPPSPQPANGALQVGISGHARETHGARTPISCCFAWDP
jgi:hypothetical protein